MPTLNYGMSGMIVDHKGMRFSYFADFARMLKRSGASVYGSQYPYIVRKKVYTDEGIHNITTTFVNARCW